MYSVIIAYALWFLSGFGALGLHRFYLGKIGTGIIWFFTGGLGMIGAIIDFFVLPNMVRESNLRLGYRDAMLSEGAPPRTQRIGVPKESLEKMILRIAKQNRGIVAATEAALEADVTLDEAKSFLEKLTVKGFAEMRIRKSGVIVYCFPEFMDGDDGEFEDL